jgi:hypothetical protein
LEVQLQPPCKTNINAAKSRQKASLDQAAQLQQFTMRHQSYFFYAVNTTGASASTSADRRVLARRIGREYDIPL